MPMYRAEVQPTSENSPDRVAHSGLWKVVIYEGERLVRTYRDYIPYFEAKRIADDLNSQFGITRKAKGAGR
jgi:hypothetical protein